MQPERKSMDLSLYLVTDRALALGRPIEEIVRQAISGGVSAVQLREKETPSGAFFELAHSLRAITGEAGVTFIVNDRLDIALAAEADGVHVGQDDLPVETARRLLGPGKILGVTAADEQQARLAEKAGADYIGCNAVFPTQTKTDTGPAIGLEGLRRLVESVDIPVVAIGGINADNAGEVLAAGVAGIAVVSAIVSAEEPQKAAGELREIIEREKSGG